MVQIKKTVFNFLLFDVKKKRNIVEVCPEKNKSRNSVVPPPKNSMNGSLRGIICGGALRGKK